MNRKPKLTSDSYPQTGSLVQITSRPRDFIKPLLAAAIATMLCGCATTGGMRSPDLDQGITRLYSGKFEAVFSATRAAITNAGLAIESYEEIDEETAMIIAKKDASFFSWGELVRVVVERASPDKVSVRVLTKRKLATNVTARGDYSNTIFSNIDLLLR